MYFWFFFFRKKLKINKSTLFQIGFFSRESETMKNQNNLEPENENNNLENSTSSQPLSIPKTNSIPLSDLSLSSLPFSAMSISTLGSSIGSALGISQASNETENLPIYTLEDVRQHCHEHDAWIVLYDKVYDITSFMLKVFFRFFSLSVSHYTIFCIMN